MKIITTRAKASFWIWAVLLVAAVVVVALLVL
jgi:hypothetical protein